MRLNDVKRFYAKNKKAVIAVATVCAVLVVAVTVWAFQNPSAPKRPVSFASTKLSTASNPAKREMKAEVKSDVKLKTDTLAKGISLYEAKKYGEAIDVFQPLVDENVEARYWLGKAHLADGNDFRGCRQLRLYVEGAPKGRYVTPAKTAMKKC